MFKKSHLGLPWAWLAMFLLMGVCPVFGAGFKQLHGHVPEAVKKMTAIGRLSATNELHLAIGVPLQDPAGLDKLLADVYDPASPNYRHFLTPAEFTARFSATEADYAAVKEFARTNGFKITGEHGNRLLLNVIGKVGDVERAFHIKLNKFKHPTEAREFFAPDAEPMMDVGLPVADIQGMSDYSRPHPKSRRMDAPAILAPKSGSGSGGAYLGDDFRNAYAPGTTLTGAGQQVGLLQFDGFYPSDIVAYAAAAGGGRTNIQIQTVMIGATNWSIGVNGGNDEVSLDIEMAMAMAPGLAKIVVYEASSANQVNNILAAMVTNTAIKQFSCSWGWSGGSNPTTENYFSQMAAQGQSFFNASGDGDAFVDGSNNDVNNSSQATYPSGSPNITQVGGTVLTMNGTGASYASEIVWNDRTVNANGGNWGSSGGISTNFIPYWQTNIVSVTNGTSKGSLTGRNVPDVAMTAKNVYVISGGSQTGGSFGGTSAAAPLWAGFMALVNQQAVNLGSSSAGFINPAIYVIGKGTNYTACFHDTTSGDNYWPSSTTKFPAVTGYDLCTGWGTPTGTNLINALVGTPDALGITPLSGFTASGAAGGPFSGGVQIFTLTNTGAANLNWSLINTSAWLTASNASGSLAGSKGTNVTVSLAAAANNLPLGIFTASVLFSNQATHIVQSRQFTLHILSALVVAPTNGFSGSGPVGGGFGVVSQNFALTNLSATALNWGVVNTSAWLSASSPGGTLAGATNTSLTISLNAAANTLPVGIYTATVLVTNQSGPNVSLNFALSVGQNLVQNGGFETGDSSGWTLVDGGGPDNVTSSTIPPHTGGTYCFAFGQANSLATLSQSLATVSGQTYLFSFWLSNPQTGSTEIFEASWNGTNVYAITNPSTPITAWTNLNFVVTATSASTLLQFSVRNDPWYFGLDDVSVTPIPAPTFTSYRNTTNGFALTWNTLAGLTNIVQYKTNLLQTNWINLVTNVAATNTLSYTNLIGVDPRRFYRVQRLP